MLISSLDYDKIVNVRRTFKKDSKNESINNDDKIELTLQRSGQHLRWLIFKDFAQHFQLLTEHVHFDLVSLIRITRVSSFRILKKKLNSSCVYYLGHLQFSRAYPLRPRPSKLILNEDYANF